MMAIFAISIDDDRINFRFDFSERRIQTTT